MGRVISIEPDEIVLEQGRLPTGSGELHVDCTADGLAKREVRPVFDGATITLQSLFMCQQVFSSAVIGKVESLDVDEKAKNELCQVVPHPEFSRDFVAASAISMENIGRWGKRFGRWLRGSRLFMAHHESLSKLVLSQLRDRRYLAAASENLTRILEQEFGSAEPPA